MRTVGKYSFLKGLNKIPRGQVRDLRHDIMDALGVTAYTTWLDRLYGIVEPRVSEASAIESVFEKYGITDIWGE